MCWRTDSSYNHNNFFVELSGYCLLAICGCGTAKDKRYEIEDTELSDGLTTDMYLCLIQITWKKIGQFLSDLQVDCQRWMYTVGSAFYSQSIHEITELNFQFILWFRLQTSDNGGECQTQFFILCVPVWERGLVRGKKSESLAKQVGEKTILYYLQPARRDEAIPQTF